MGGQFTRRLDDFSPVILLSWCWWCSSVLFLVGWSLFLSFLYCVQPSCSLTYFSILKFQSVCWGTILACRCLHLQSPQKYFFYFCVCHAHTRYFCGDNGIAQLHDDEFQPVLLRTLRL
eukprot:TRINITY_DN55450_c0_g1_i1.p1 TRINITY_DN55450_c0_g1~~TRINITY_DN55450_c0_g1_i1.p1  ORF type:complete len:118 (-),score=10.38 TRINITY_DN55450_c0_g1_i1:11-364(-)